MKTFKVRLKANKTPVPQNECSSMRNCDFDIAVPLIVIRIWIILGSFTVFWAMIKRKTYQSFREHCLVKKSNTDLEHRPTLSVTENRIREVYTGVGFR